MPYRELNDETYTDLRKRLIKEKGSEIQRKFLTALKDSERFLDWLKEQGLKIHEEGEEFDVVADNLTENEFKEQPVQVERELFQKWRLISPAQACRATFWGYITRLHIEKGKIESFFLAANGGTLPGGSERIDAAIKEGSASKMDEIVRTALRRFSGLPGVRGNRTVYVDCPFARAWWRCHIADEVCQTADGNANPDKVINLLRTSQAYWETLVGSVVSKNSVFGNNHIRSSLIWALSEKDLQGTSLSTSKGLNKVIKLIGVRLAWQELAIYPPDELKKIFEQDFLK